MIGFVALAFIIRLPLLAHPDYTNFPEFYRDYYIADHITRGQWPLAGPPSMQTNFRFGPIYYYLLVPLFILSIKNPISLLLTGIILYALSAGVCYRLLQKWFKDEYAARAGALFYAVSIYGLHLTSYISNPNFLPLFILLFLFFLAKILEGSWSPADFILLGLWYGVAAQLHATAALVLPVIAVWPLWKALKSRPWGDIAKKLLAAGSTAALSAAPYLIYQIQTKFLGLTALLRFSKQHLQGEHFSAATSALADFFSAALNPFDISRDYAYLQPNWLYVFIAAAAILAMIALLWNIFAKRQQAAPGAIITPNGRYFASAWLLTICLMVLLFNRGIHDHYLIILWPWPALLFAYSSQWLRQKLAITTAFLVLFVVIWSLQAYSLFAKPRENWNDVIALYHVRYQNEPATANIGFSAIQQ